MSFATSEYLRKATSRAKSDVANKLVSMFLHDVSRRITATLGVNVTDPVYANAVAAEFGSNCCYCGLPLENDRASVEHLEGMNRFRVGLHIPGNVVVACRRCNGEKRRDDQLQKCTLGPSGWQSFLCHDSSRCPPTCKTCGYWTRVWLDASRRTENLAKASQRIEVFRSGYPESVEWSRKAKIFLRQELDKLYRECQEFATARIKQGVDDVFSDLSNA
jgi:hypothetical protein